MKNYTEIHKKNRVCFIYCLFNKNNVPIYVGKSVNEQRRFKQHKCFFSKKEDVESFEILEETTIENALFLEMYWTHQFLQWGFNLENITNNFKTEMRNKELRQEQAKERKISDKKFKNEAAILGLTTKEYLQYIITKRIRL